MLTARQRSALLTLALLAVGVLVCALFLSACAGELTTVPTADGLPCANTATPPDRFLVPHRYTDSTALIVTTVGDPLFGRTLGYILRGWPIEERHCLTILDSIRIYGPYPSAVPSRAVPSRVVGF